MEIDNNFSNLTNQKQIIKKYSQNLKKLRNYAERNGNITENQFSEFMFFKFYQYISSTTQNPQLNSQFLLNQENNFLNFNYLTNINNYSTLRNELIKKIVDRKRKILFWAFYLAIGFLCVSYKNEASALILRNIQTFIYPGMKLWRKVTLPVINNFPGLTELYDESCLMTNPFFQVDDLNCEPCVGVVNVLNLHSNSIDKLPEFVPFIFKVNQDPVTVNDIFNLYNTNKEIFQQDAYRVRSSNLELTNLDELFIDFNRTHQQESHSLWRCNRMPPARLLRQLFVRPEILPSTGISLERYLSFDTPNAESYVIPDSECSNIYIQQALGTRTYILRPTIECRHKCRTISIRLPQSFVLSYNWWYWKPISIKDSMSKSDSISFIGSYC